MAWEIFMCGRPAMAAKTMIAIVMDTQLRCGQFQLIVRLTTARMPITMRAVAQHWPARSVTVPKTRIQASPPLICMANVQQHIRARVQLLPKRPAFLHWHLKRSK